MNVPKRQYTKDNIKDNTNEWTLKDVVEHYTGSEKYSNKHNPKTCGMCRRDNE